MHICTFTPWRNSEWCSSGEPTLPSIHIKMDREGMFFTVINRGSVRHSYSLMFWLKNATSYVVQPEFPLKPVQSGHKKEVGVHCNRNWDVLSQGMWQGQMYLTELQMGIYFTTWRDFSKNMELEKWYLIALWLAMFQISIKKWIFLVFLETSKKIYFQGSLYSPVEKIILRTSS